MSAGEPWPLAGAEPRPGAPDRLGSCADAEGVSFAVVSRHATAVDLCLFDSPRASSESARYRLDRGHDGVWLARIPSLGPGQVYGYRVEGPHRPEQGHRFNPAKLLIDPYCRAVAGELTWNEALLGSAPNRDDADPRDSAGWVPKSVVVEDDFDWRNDRRPGVPWRDTVIYECHVKGLTWRHPEVPEQLRGTYLGLACEPVIDHLRRLGVTTVELMPVQQFVPERHLAEQGRVNYWGYSPLAFFAPHAGYASVPGRQVREFKQMVAALHRAGLEGVLDVVFNHTCEGDADGPTLSFRGLDNALYYRLAAERPRRYRDFVGCGNTLDLRQGPVLRLVVDCLRYWVEEMHVDGFRFDLATSLVREPEEFNVAAGLFAAVAAEPALSRVKLIAEPSDLAPGGDQYGNYPAGWREWNHPYRDSVRGFWRGDSGGAPGLARRLTGSPDIFSPDRGPLATVNYVTCHDGFTLDDLVSYERKDNWANGEQNRDGRDLNFSRNWGVEGATADPEILARRRLVTRSLLATLALSQGVPMLSQGDEMGRTQRGNNNAYCQDNETSWVDWELSPRNRELLEYTRSLFDLRRRHGALRSRRFHTPDELVWLASDGGVLVHDPRDQFHGQAFGLLLPSGEAGTEAGEESLLLLVNGGEADVEFVLPRPRETGGWVAQLDTASPWGSARLAAVSALRAHSVQLLIWTVDASSSPAPEPAG